jgi:hypothetical protein
MDISTEVGGHVLQRGGVCQIKVWLDDNPQYSDEELVKAVADHGKAALLRWLRTKGFTAGDSVITRHFNRGCKCP